MHLKIYYKSSIPFFCERNEKFLIFSINVVMTCDFSSIEICRTVGVRNKGLWMTEKWYSFVSSWSWRSIYGLNCIIRFIISHLYHLSVSEMKSFWCSASISSSYVTLHRFKYMGYGVWEAKGQVWVKVSVVSFVFKVRGRCLAWIRSSDIF